MAAGEDRIEIRLLRSFRVFRGDESLALGGHAEVVLHALAMCGSRGVSRRALETVLPEATVYKANAANAVKNALTDLRKQGIEIPNRKNPVTIRPGEHLSIDLWDFFEHVKAGRYEEAAKLVEGELEPCLLDEDGEHNELFARTFAEFESAKDTVYSKVHVSSEHARSTREMRSWLLDRSLVPGVGKQAPIGDVRDRVGSIEFPWRFVRPDDGLGRGTLSDYLFERLSSPPSAPQQLILVGGHGMGKTVAAIDCYLRLTDPATERNGEPPSQVLYADPRVEGSQPGFATDDWLEERLPDRGTAGERRSIVIMPNADVFFSRAELELEELLTWRVFRDCDVILCCSEQVYSRGLQYEEYGTRVVRLDLWSDELQSEFASALCGDTTRDAFVEWRDADLTGTRSRLCAVPLNLTHVLSLVENEPEAVQRISTPWHLFDQVARIRLRASRQTAHEDDLFNELAAVAHRFYLASMPADWPIGFNPEELRDFLRARDPVEVESRLDTILNRTLLTVPAPGSDEYHFEDTAWGWFFVACHLALVLKQRGSVEPVRRAFAKRLSTEVLGICEEMLRELKVRHEEPILRALYFAFFEDAKTELSPTHLAVAREQIGYLLARFADPATRKEMEAIIDPRSDNADSDERLRHAISLGLSGADAAEFCAEMSDDDGDDRPTPRGSAGATA